MRFFYWKQKRRTVLPYTRIYMIPASFRFHGHNSLRYVYTNGKAVRSQPLTIKWIKNTHRSKPRISVVVSKKVIKSAIGRNRIRRRIYEYIRTHLDKLNDVYDIVVITTSPELKDMPYTELAGQMDILLKKAGVYKTPQKWYNLTDIAREAKRGFTLDEHFWNTDSPTNF